jgi:hypothetical protein
MKSAERYRRYASECLKLAQSIASEVDKALFLQMAESWRRLAERREVRHEAQMAEQDDRNEQS